jgi:hypothetical protein
MIYPKVDAECPVSTGAAHWCRQLAHLLLLTLLPSQKPLILTVTTSSGLTIAAPYAQLK